MHWRQKAKLALEILRRRGKSHPFEHLSELDQHIAREIIAYVMDLIREDAVSAIDQMMVLGLNNKEIAARSNSDEGVISRIHLKSDDLQIAIPTLLAVTVRLQALVPVVTLERALQTLMATPVVAIDFCQTKGRPIDEGDVEAATQIVVRNLVYGLTGNFDKRVPLPPPFLGILARLGPAPYGMQIYQSEGRNDIELLSHEIHELDHVLNRMKDRLSRLKNKTHETMSAKQKTKPRSEF